jgi:hypothetical protein
MRNSVKVQATESIALGAFSVRSGRNISVCEESLVYRNESQRSNLQSEAIPVMHEKKTRPVSAYTGLAGTKNLSAEVPPLLITQLNTYVESKAPRPNTAVQATSTMPFRKGNHGRNFHLLRDHKSTLSRTFKGLSKGSSTATMFHSRNKAQLLYERS